MVTILLELTATLSKIQHSLKLLENVNLQIPLLLIGFIFHYPAKSMPHARLHVCGSLVLPTNSMLVQAIAYFSLIQLMPLEMGLMAKSALSKTKLLLLHTFPSKAVVL